MPEAKSPRAPQVPAPRQQAAARNVLAEVTVIGGGPAGMARERAA